MYCEMHGQGEPLVLLHGFTGSSASWGEIGRALSKKFQVIMPDLRGHGRSTYVPSKYTFGQVALDVYALLDKLQIRKFKCMGCSGGASALLHMATQQPERVDAMVLVSATTHYPAQARAIMAQVSVDTLSEEQWQSLRKLHFHGDAQIRELYEHVRGFAADVSDMDFTHQDLATITASTLLVQGDRDFLYPIDISIEMYKAIPKCSLWVVPNAGHCPISEENTAQFIKNITDFLSTCRC